MDSRRILEPSFRIDPSGGRVAVDGKEVSGKKKEYVILNKPKGVTTTRKDRFADKTVMDCLPPSLRHLNPAGRLDKNTTGLLILTNDGELIDRLTHPRYGLTKTYSVTTDKRLAPPDKRKLERGILLDGKKTYPCEIAAKRNGQLNVALREGRKRQIRRMFSALGYGVLKLKRVREGSISLGSLAEGEWRYLTADERGKLWN